MKKVALIGFAQSTRMEAPFDDPEVEIWGLNEGYVRETPRVTRWFQLHDYHTFSRANNTNDPDHFAWLRKKHNFPIYMQKDYRQIGIPNCKVYPIDKVVERFGLDTPRGKRLYATSSFSFMIYLAMLEGFDWIGIYGFEMATGSEYFHQRASAEFAIGMALGMGIQIALPENSNLLRGRMYAYEDESIGIRQHLEFRHGALVHQIEKQTQKFYEKQGRFSAIEDIATGRLVIDQALREKEQQELLNEMAVSNTINGAIEEVKLMLQVYDNQNGSVVVEDVLKKEIE